VTVVAETGFDRQRSQVVFPGSHAIDRDPEAKAE